jgi:hypothetical protein
MKLNDGAGFYLICTNKKELDYEEEKKKFRRWWKVNNYLMYSEMQNRARKRMIVVEKYIDDFENNEQPTDYKFYCFDGEPVAILVVWERDVDTKKIFMSMHVKNHHVLYIISFLLLMERTNLKLNKFLHILYKNHLILLIILLI